jgi:hypothetical protein
MSNLLSETMMFKLIIESIGKGRKNAVSRIELMNRTGMPDRKNRRIIEALQNKGVPIVNMQDGRGYFIAETLEEVTHYINQERARAMKIIKKANSMRAWFREGGKQ